MLYLYNFNVPIITVLRNPDKADILIANSFSQEVVHVSNYSRIF